MPVSLSPRRRIASLDRTAARRFAYGAGRSAEDVAILYLRLKGYRILARRYLVKGGEIDVVAQRDRTIVFVEVKLRPTIDGASVALAPAQCRRISRAARVFIGRQHARDLTFRADAIYCAPWRWPLHVPAAFELHLD